MNAAQKALAKIGAGKTATVIQHPAKLSDITDNEKIVLPADIATEVQKQTKHENEQSHADKAKAAQAALANLKSGCAINQFGTFVVKAQFGKRIDAVGIESEAGEDYIRQVMQSAVKKMPPKAEIGNIQAEMRIDARRANRRLMMFQRIATHDGTRYIDLGDADGSCIRVGATGWEIAHNTEIAFTRGRGYGQLPMPIQATSARHAFKLVLDWLISLGILKSRAALVTAALVAWLRTGNAYPLLLFYGSPGAGKTVAAKLVMMLIDPTDSMKLPNVQTDSEHIAAAAQHRWVLTFDNESKLSAAEQDLFCTCSTGGEIVTRAMYTNGDIATLPIHRPVLITAVQPVVTRPDLMSRTIPIEFAPREIRKGEDEILDEFMKMRPALLGALCELLVAGEGA
jgi:hypothetical protein